MTNFSKRIPRLGEILIQKGWITWQQLDEALKIQSTSTTHEFDLTPHRHDRVDKETFLNIGEILLNQGWIKPEDLAEALQLQQETGTILGGILLSRNYVTEKNLQHALAIQHGMGFAELDKISISPQVTKLIPKRIAYEYRFLPLVENDHSLLLALDNPKNLNPESWAQTNLSHYKVLFALMTPSDLTKSLFRCYGPEA